MRRFLLVIAIGLLTLSSAAAQAQDTAPAQSTWTMTSAQSVQEVIGEAYSPTFLTFLSPDGSALAWNEGTDAISVYTFADSNVTTYPAPENCCGFGRFSSPSWSPEGHYFTFTESNFDRFVDSDIWMLDREGGDITDRTDDGVFGGMLEATDPFDMDYLPTWNPANGDLYFFRSSWEDKTTGLYLLPVGRPEPKLITDLTPQLPVFSVYRPTAISPDGKRIAFIVIGNDIKDERNGIYTLDLKTGDATQVATVEDLRAGLPTWQTDSLLFPEFLQWAGNDALVVLSTDPQFATGITRMAYYVDLAAETVTPLATFEDVAEAPDLYREDGPEAPIYRMPRSGVVAPDGSAFFYLRAGADNRANAGISMLPLPPDGSAPVDLGTIDGFDVTHAASAPPVMAPNGRAFFFGYLFQFEPSP